MITARMVAERWGISIVRPDMVASSGRAYDPPRTAAASAGDDDGQSDMERRGAGRVRRHRRRRRQSLLPAAVGATRLLETSASTTHCPWKGEAHYYSVVVNGERNANAAWYYPEPKPAAKQIKDRIAFWRGVQVA